GRAGEALSPGESVGGRASRSGSGPGRGGHFRRGLAGSEGSERVVAGRNRRRGPAGAVEQVAVPGQPGGLMRKFAAEVFGTFCLVFAGTGAIIINDLHPAVTHVGVALTFGLVVLALIYALGEVSGAHLNPAVTVGFLLAGRFPARLVPGYVLAQCA